MTGISFVKVGADHRGIADPEFGVGQHRDAAERAQTPKFVVAEERRDGVDLIVDALEIKARQYLADIGADKAADDRNHSPRMQRARTARKIRLDTLHL